MSEQRSGQAGRRAGRARLPLIVLLGIFQGLGGCLSLHHEAPKPGYTQIGSHPVVLAAQLLGNSIVVEAKGNGKETYHFLIDTGSSVTLVSPELANRLAAKDMAAPAVPKIRVRSSAGGYALLDPTVLSELQLGSAHFESIPALIYDCTDLSEQLGVPIDGILGFPLFRKIILTLDYPNKQVVLRSVNADFQPQGSTISFDNGEKTPLIPVRIGNREFIALVDSGSDVALSVNPVGLTPKFQVAPVVGPTVATLAGDRQLLVGRLAEDLTIGSYAVQRPVVDLTDDLSAVGSAILKHFAVTFDQEHDRVTFYCGDSAPLSVPSIRGTGLSFRKTPAYWRVVDVIPSSPAADAGVEPGDLVIRIDGEAVSKWPLNRYDKALATSDSFSVTFLNGSKEIVRSLRIIDLVP